MYLEYLSSTLSTTNAGALLVYSLAKESWRQEEYLAIKNFNILPFVPNTFGCQVEKEEANSHHYDI